VPIVLNSGNLKLLEPSGPVQACNGIALPFLYAINNGDPVQRIQFCEAFQRNLLQNVEFASENNWPDEGLFKVCDTMNGQN